MHLRTSLLAVGVAAVPCLASPMLGPYFLSRSKYGTEAVAHTFDVAKNTPHYMENVAGDTKHSPIEIHLQARDEAVDNLHSDGSVISHESVAALAVPRSPSPSPKSLAKGKKLCPNLRKKLLKNFLEILVAAENTTSKKPLTCEKVAQLKERAKGFESVLRMPLVHKLSKHPGNRRIKLEQDLFELLITIEKSGKAPNAAQTARLHKITHGLMMQMLAEESRGPKKGSKKGSRKHGKRDVDEHSSELEKNLYKFLLEISEAEKPIHPGKKIQLQNDLCSLIELKNGADYNKTESKHSKRDSDKKPLPAHLEPKNRTQQRLVEVALKALAVFLTPEVPEEEKVPDADDGPKELNKRDFEEASFEDESFDDEAYFEANEVSFDQDSINAEISSHDEADALAMQLGPSDKHPRADSFDTEPEHFEHEEENFEEHSLDEAGFEDVDRFETLPTPPWNDSDDVDPEYAAEDEDVPTPPWDDSEDVEDIEEEDIPTPPWAVESENEERPIAPWEIQDVEVEEENRPIAPWEIDNESGENRPTTPWESEEADVEEETRPIAPWETGSEEQERPTAPWETGYSDRPIAPWESDNGNVVTSHEVGTDAENPENLNSREDLEAFLGPHKEEIMNSNAVENANVTWYEITSPARTKITHVITSTAD